MNSPRPTPEEDRGHRAKWLLIYLVLALLIVNLVVALIVFSRN